MPNDFPILSLIALSPLLGVIVLLFIPKHAGRWIRIVGIATTVLPLILSAWLYVSYNHQTGGVQFRETHSWIKIPLNQEAQSLSQFKEFFLSFKYALGVDGLSLPLIFLTALISVMAALASVNIKKRWKTFYILFLLLETGMFGVFMARDLLLFFLSFELTLVPTFFMIAIWGYFGKERAANKFLLYNGVGSALMLIAFVIVIVTAGFTFNQVSDTEVKIYYSGNLDTITHNIHDSAGYANMDEKQFPDNPFYMSNKLKWALFILLLIAFGIKLPIFPFHTWMLNVHAEAPPALVMIHSGILLKMGAYGLIRFGILLFPEQAKDAATALAILGLINIIYGAVLAFRQSDFKLVLAYSSISHMGIVLLGIAALNEIGLQGAVFQMVSHGLISALMFLIVGTLYERTGTTKLRELGGLTSSMPFISGMLLIAGLASLGLPALSGFVSELLAFLGLFDDMPVITAIGTLGIILSAVYVLRAVLKITYGPIASPFANLKDARLIEAIPMITLIAFILLLGVYPAVLTEPLQLTVKGFHQVVLNFASAKMGG